MRKEGKEEEEKGRKERWKYLTSGGGREVEKKEKRDHLLSNRQRKMLFGGAE